MNKFVLSVVSVMAFAVAFADVQKVEKVKVVHRSNPELVNRMRMRKLAEESAKKGGGKDIFAMMIDREKGKVIKAESERCKSLGLAVPTSCEFDEENGVWRMTAGNGATYVTTNMTTAIARIVGGKRRAEAATRKAK